MQGSEPIAELVYAIRLRLLAALLFLLRGVLQSLLPTTALTLSPRSWSHCGDEVESPLGLWRRVETR